MTDKIRTYNSKALGDTFVTVNQIGSKIESMLSDEIEITDLPDSLVPTHTLYAIVLCYSVMYNILLSSHLKEDGFPKQTNSIH